MIAATIARCHKDFRGVDSPTATTLPCRRSDSGSVGTKTRLAQRLFFHRFSTEQSCYYIEYKVFISKRRLNQRFLWTPWIWYSVATFYNFGECCQQKSLPIERLQLLLKLQNCTTFAAPKS
jgi:hypothetical protein